MLRSKADRTNQSKGFWLPLKAKVKRSEMSPRIASSRPQEAIH